MFPLAPWSFPTLPDSWRQEMIGRCSMLRVESAQPLVFSAGIGNILSVLLDNGSQPS